MASRSAPLETPRWDRRLARRGPIRIVPILLRLDGPPALSHAVSPLLIHVGVPADPVPVPVGVAQLGRQEEDALESDPTFRLFKPRLDAAGDVGVVDPVLVLLRAGRCGGGGVGVVRVRRGQRDGEVEVETVEKEESEEEGENARRGGGREEEDGEEDRHCDAGDMVSLVCRVTHGATLANETLANEEAEWA